MWRCAVLDWVVQVWLRWGWVRLRCIPLRIWLSQSKLTSKSSLIQNAGDSRGRKETVPPRLVTITEPWPTLQPPSVRLLRLSLTNQQIRQIVNSQSQDRAKKAQHKQVHSTSTVNCSETFTSNTNQVPGTSVLNSSHQFNVVFASKAKRRQLVLSVSQKCCVKI